MKFIKSAMNYGQFQIWLLDNQIKGVNVTLNEKINKFLAETSADEILKLYDIEQNYNQNNIELIRKTIENNSYGVMPNITQERRKVLAKNLINSEKK